MLNMIPEIDAKQLKVTIVKLAARIKQKDKGWPEKPLTTEWRGFRIWVGATPKQGFRRVTITPPGKASWAVTLIDANPKKVRYADRKVMVYLTIAGQHRIQNFTGQIVIRKPRPILRWFEDKKEVKVC